MQRIIKKYGLVSAAGVLLCLLLVLELFRGKIFTSEEYGELAYVISTRLAGGGACLLLIIRADFGDVLKPSTTWKKFLIFLPCMAVAVNNFPFIPYFSGDAYINDGALPIVVYGLSCLAVGFFEEMAFRGCIFSVILQRIGHKRAGVFWSIVASSAVFGIIHLLNIAAGASVGAVILQVGYSFLIGAMCSIILVRTQNIWYCVVLHGVYNFAGGVVPQCGGGEIWTVPEIVLTTAVAIPVAAYVIYLVVTTKYGGEEKSDGTNV